MLSLVSCNGYVSAPMLAGRQLTSAPRCQRPHVHRRLGRQQNRSPHQRSWARGPLDSRFQRRRSFQLHLPWWCPGCPLGSLWSNLPPHWPSSWDKCPFSLQFQHVLTVPAPLPSLALLTATLCLGLWCSRRSTPTCQITDFFHIFGTFCRSEGSLLKCDQCFHILDMLAVFGCYVCHHLSLPCHPFLVFLCSRLHQRSQQPVL